MRVFAPGKLVLCGAYAVLEGHPALACAVSSGVIAEGTADATTYEEIRAANVTPAQLDVSALYHRDDSGDRKLGLGASAAALVATLALRAAERGEDVSSAPVRGELFDRAFAAHAKAQSGGSGVDIAASVYGGAIAYTMGEPVRALTLPKDIVLRAYFCGASASTPSMRARVLAFRARDAKSYGAVIETLAHASARATAACEAGDAVQFVSACRATLIALGHLGEGADVAIVTPEVARADAMLRAEEAVFFPAGAGGGDCAVYVGLEAPSAQFERELSERGMVPLPLTVDDAGVRALHLSAAGSSRN